MDVISCEWFHYRNACVVHEQVDRVPAGFRDEIGNATCRREIVNQRRHLRALRLDNFSRLRERHRIASVQQQFHVFASELFRNGAADPAAGACDEIPFHAPVRNVERPTLNVQCRIKW